MRTVIAHRDRNLDSMRAIVVIKLILAHEGRMVSLAALESLCRQVTLDRSRIRSMSFRGCAWERSIHFCCSIAVIASMDQQKVREKEAYLIRKFISGDFYEK